MSHSNIDQNRKFLEPAETMEQLKQLQTKMEGELNHLLDSMNSQSKIINDFCTNSMSVCQDPADGSDQSANTGGIFSRWFPARDEVLEKLKKECAQLKKEKLALAVKLTEMESQYVLQSRRLESEESLRKDVNVLKKSKSKLESDLLFWKQKCETAEKKLEKQKRKKAIVKMYFAMKSSIIDKIVPEVNWQLQSIADQDGMQLNLEQVSAPQKVETSTPLLVFCVNATRLGTDVDNSLQYVTNKEKTMVIILHHKDAHALPSQPSDKLLIGPAYQTLAGITDMAFTSTKGLYSCEMNSRGIKTIARFIVQNTSLNDV
ncbi:hypothetical protein ScPMuIL_008111 [Solemya velum]